MIASHAHRRRIISFPNPKSYRKSSIPNQPCERSYHIMSRAEQSTHPNPPACLIIHSFFNDTRSQLCMTHRFHPFTAYSSVQTRAQSSCAVSCRTRSNHSVPFVLDCCYQEWRVVQLCRAKKYQTASTTCFHWMAASISGATTPDATSSFATSLVEWQLSRVEK